MIEICAFADEADEAVSGQITALKENGLRLIEIRNLDGKNVSELTEDEARKYAELFSEAGISVWSIGSPLGKISIEDDLPGHMALTRHVCRIAKIFGTDKIRMFSFKKAKEKPEAVFEALRRMVEIAREEGVQLYHENENGIFGQDPEGIEAIMANVEGLKYVYDPANFLGLSIPVKTTLEKLYDKTSYFHVKDVILETKEQVPAGHGDGRLGEIVMRVPSDTIMVFTIEPHLKVISPDDLEKAEALREKNKKFYTDHREAFDVAVNEFKKLLESEGYKDQDGIYTKG